MKRLLRKSPCGAERLQPKQTGAGGISVRRTVSFSGLLRQSLARFCFAQKQAHRNIQFALNCVSVYAIMNLS